MFTDPSGFLDTLIEGWAARGMKALAMLAPDPVFHEKRSTLLVRPSIFQAAADHLASSDAYGQSWRDSDSPSVAWIDTSRNEPWLLPWVKMGCRGIIRVGMDMPGGKQIELYAASGEELNRPMVAEFVLDLMAAWPQIKRYVLTPLSGLTGQQLRVLNMSFHGLSAKECAVSLGVTERTVNHHLAIIQEKLGTQSKLESISKAIWRGAI
jgi:DNA-binding CsgD family transcriptional regulator